MEKILCVLRDSKADTFGPVSQFDNADVAVRCFFDLCRDFSTLIGKHPEDFCIAKVGYFYPETGDVAGCKFTVLANGSDLAKEE